MQKDNRPIYEDKSAGTDNQRIVKHRGLKIFVCPGAQDTLATPLVATHKVVLEKVCQCLSNYNLGISLPKCVLGQPSLNYLGYQISAEGYTATDKKVKAINDYPLPSNLR